MAKTLTIADSFCTKHLTGAHHPECPARFDAVYKLLVQKGLITSTNKRAPRLADKHEILLCHTQPYFNIVVEEVRRCASQGILDGSATLSTGDVQFCPDSLEAALRAVGAVLTGVTAVMEGTADRAFSLIRPPGHHACRSRGMGFCIFNNVAIGARYVQKIYGLKRILIVDWDVHHGNGTQDIFEEDPSVFYFSTHQKGLYPGTGSSEDCGTGPGKGTKLNVPILPGPQSRLQVLEAFNNELVQAMETFQPEFVFISAGFDAHYADPLGGFNLTEDDFATLTAIVLAIAERYAKGRVVSAMEGGYHLQALALSAAAHVKKMQES